MFGAQFNQQQRNLQQQAYQQNAVNPKRASYSSRFINTPVVTANTSSGALMQIRLVSYTNEQLSLPHGKTCVCPQGKTCPFLKPGIPSCMFSFTIIVSAPEQSVQYISSEFMPATDPTLNSGNWTTLHTMNLTSRPMAIDVFVHHLGVVIDQQTAQLEFYNYVVLVDTFVIPLANYDASQGAGTSTTATGILQQTQLQLEYSVQCANGKQGPSCDLTCTPTPGDSSSAVCVSSITGVVQSCEYSGVQVRINCPRIQIHFSICRTLPTVKYVPMVGDVSSAYRVWTIVLGCLLGVSIIFIILLIIFYVIARNQQLSDEKERQHQDYLPAAYTSPGTQPLMQKDDEWDRGDTRATGNLQSSSHDNETISNVR
ncbi:unnamed protein product [Anisakis simplex]|uniref:Transmembrane protein n=1 Tax=Anisakis simplex TaxID=6269 RepID=A0A0M3JVX7_ANISI|nr:unnamed protein product [Anisakis simplex]